MADIEKYFNKKFTFSKYNLPPCNNENTYVEEKWTDPHLEKLKAELNNTKSLLNDKEVNHWRKHTDFTNRAGYVLDTIKCCYKITLLTQAWCKFYEILHSYGLVDTLFFRSLHICEAPGAFINALEFYLDSKRQNHMWQWVGNTLNPYYEGHSMSTAVFDDRFILPTYPCWNFGPNNTGDIMDPGFLDSLMEQVQANGPFHLVTADGSVDCQNLPDQQETLVAGLHFAEVVIALHCLAPNGNLVVKKFTLLECDSVCLTFLLTCLFNKVNVFKPVTSKPGNSEVYVICQGFRATEASMILPILRENLIKAVAYFYPP
ncbi:CMTR2 [Cordylochernes scorpioides]|uniref:Cap-specific mRNA (nucleoside-2'-O-)-methyltransferase 2 n=1 Tax=Cordylochernes scorpioides TaxID=51811 RepID=A0ABY6L0J5_9ARAC|nr:CMTR2 [Cordylochernes scorpioides]